jgi:aminopeptidase N
MATFVQYIGLQAVAAEFNSWDNFITQVLQRALTVDANPDATHPLKIGEEVWFDKNAMSWFDTISYEKGGSIARMMEGFLTPSVFLEGLKTYQELK